MFVSFQYINSIIYHTYELNQNSDKCVSFYVVAISEINPVNDHRS